MVFAYIGLRRSRGGTHLFSGSALLVAGYLSVWVAFSIAATLLQWGLLEAVLITPMLNSASALFSGILLIGAGITQFSNLKDACLTKCRSPVQFMLESWRNSLRGAFVLGVKNGVLYLGCCWALMLVPLAIGVMSLAGMLAITALVLVEKLFPAGDVIGRIAGAGLILWGGVLLLRSFAS